MNAVREDFPAAAVNVHHDAVDVNRRVVDVNNRAEDVLGEAVDLCTGVVDILDDKRDANITDVGVPFVEVEEDF